jgi:antirestriction protein
MNVMDSPIPAELASAIEATAEQAAVPPTTVTAYLARYGSTAADHRTLTETFNAAYQGRWANERVYAGHVARQRGWPAAMEEAGIPARMLDLRALADDLFAAEFWAVREGASIDVFRNPDADCRACGAPARTACHPYCPEDPLTFPPADSSNFS